MKIEKLQTVNNHIIDLYKEQGELERKLELIKSSIELLKDYIEEG